MNQPIEVVPRIFVSSLAALQNDSSFFTKQKVTHAIQVMPDQFSITIPDTVKQYRINLLDVSDAPIEKEFENTGKFLSQALAEPESKIVIYSKNGVSRAPTILAAYLLQYDPQFKQNVDNVLDEINKKHRKADPNTGFVKQLENYAKKCSS